MSFLGRLRKEYTRYRRSHYHTRVGNRYYNSKRKLIWIDRNPPGHHVGYVRQRRTRD